MRNCRQKMIISLCGCAEQDELLQVNYVAGEIQTCRENNETQCTNMKVCI